MLKTPITISDSIYRVLVSAEYYVSPGAILQVLITNDAYAINPVWEDMTTSFLNNDYHIFTNTTINGLRPGMNIRFKVDVGNSTELSWIGRFGIFSE
jgi:citrate lyase alpha subunit